MIKKQIQLLKINILYWYRCASSYLRVNSFLKCYWWSRFGTRLSETQGERGYCYPGNGFFLLYLPNKTDWVQHKIQHKNWHSDTMKSFLPQSLPMNKKFMRSQKITRKDCSQYSISAGSHSKFILHPRGTGMTGTLWKSVRKTYTQVTFPSSPE